MAGRPHGPLKKLSTKEALGQPVDPNNRRAEPRATRTETLFVQVRSVASAGDERSTLRCESADLSRGGIRIQVSIEIPKDELLEIWIKVQGQPRNFYLAGRACWCAPNARGAELGIKLHDAPGTDYKAWRRHKLRAKPERATSTTEVPD